MKFDELRWLGAPSQTREQSSRIYCPLTHKSLCFIRSEQEYMLCERTPEDTIWHWREGQYLQPIEVAARIAHCVPWADQFKFNTPPVYGATREAHRS
jgi:hypothetical protein